ncbi:MAG: MerR family transcriptional regulator [Dehalococcoidaceae bacterium]|nr:MerR family transcriptional regulator [Dehalococcoidaceae bacterium]
MIVSNMNYTVKDLSRFAGVSVRTLHYYDEKGLLKPASYDLNGYRRYGEEQLIKLQQIMFYKELGFSLEEIGQIISQPDFDVMEALKSHRRLLEKKVQRTRELINTVDKTIQYLEGETGMDIKEYYQGFSDEQIEKYRTEARQRWGEETLRESEKRVLGMGKDKFDAVQAEGGAIFQSIAGNISKGHDNPEVQALIAKWRNWLENFHHYSEDAVLGLGQAYSQHPDFAAFFRKFHPDLPEFFTRAVTYYVEQNKRAG